MFTNKEFPNFQLTKQVSNEATYADMVKSNLQQTASDLVSKKKLKDMTEAEKKDYNRKKEQERRKNMNDYKKDEMKERNRRNMEAKRALEKQMNEEGLHNEIAEQGTKLRTQYEPEFKKTKADEKSNTMAKNCGANEFEFKNKITEDKTKQGYVEKHQDEPKVKNTTSYEKPNDHCERRGSNEFG